MLNNSIVITSNAVNSFGAIPSPDLVLIDTGQVQALGFAFYNYQSVILLIISLILLLAIIGAIVLCLRSRVRV